MIPRCLGHRIRRLNILIITGIFPPDIGGPATYVPQVAKFLCDRGHDVTVFTLSECLDHARDGKHSFSVVRLPRRTFKPWRRLRTIAQIIWLGKDADILFVNGLALETALANKLLRRPLILKIVGDFAWERSMSLGWIEDSFEEFQQKRYGFRVEVLKALRAWWARQADQVIVPSHYLSRWVRNWGVPENKITIIYNGVELPNGIESADVPLQTPVNIVAVSRLIPWKRVDDVIETVARLEDVGLVVVGDGPERNRLEALVCAKEIMDRVYFAGARSRAETLSLMKACDIFVLNSTYEGLPHVVIEAMMIGLSVVATAVGGTPELVQDGQSGKLISPFHKEALYKALLELVMFPLERQRFSYEAKHTAKRFNYRRMVEETATLIEQWWTGEGPTK